MLIRAFGLEVAIPDPEPPTLREVGKHLEAALIKRGFSELEAARTIGVFLGTTFRKLEELFELTAPYWKFAHGLAGSFAESLQHVTPEQRARVAAILGLSA